MANLALSDLRSLPAEQHLFCPRLGDDPTLYFDEDRANGEPELDRAAEKERQEKLRECDIRKWLALDALQILAFDGDDALPHQQWLQQRLDDLMQNCDICVRKFYQARPEWKDKLLEQYDEDNIAEFLSTVDDLCIKRICKGLGVAENVLVKAEPKLRGVRILPSEATYAFFEALSCDSLVRNDELLRLHFDKPFKLVQTKKRLKIQAILPAMTRFLFCGDVDRRNWAIMSWTTSKRNILRQEFEWAVRDYLVDAMMRVQMNSLELPFVPPFWSGVRSIIAKLDKDLISHSIRGLDGDFYRLLLDHLSLQSHALFDILATMTLLLEKSSPAFWDAMDLICPSTATMVEQVFNNSHLNQILMTAIKDDEQSMNDLNDCFMWVRPFLASIKPANLTPVCRAFTNSLFSRLQADKYSRASRERCFKEGLTILDYALRKMNEGQASTFVGQPTVNGMLDLLSTHVNLIVTSLKRFSGMQFGEEQRLILSVIEQAFTLESRSLIVERLLIESKQPPPKEALPSRQLWTTIIKAIDQNHLDLAVHLLLAGKNLIGVEPLFMKVGVDRIPPPVRQFNERFKLLSQSITDTLDRLSEFDPGQLDALFEQPEASRAIVATLFSSTTETRNSTIELLKVISSQDERRDAIKHVLRTYLQNISQGVADSCQQVTRKKPFAPTPSLITTCSDIIDIMCNSTDGILRSRTLTPEEADFSMLLWCNLWDCIAMIFRTTEDWSNLGFYEKTTMMDFCRDTMQFAEMLFDQCSIFATALNVGQVKTEDTEKGSSSLLKELLNHPAITMGAMVKWLRLRDEFLSTKSVALIGKLLVRLHEVSIDVDPDTLSYMERVLNGEVRAKLSMGQQAQLQRALETHIGFSLAKEEPVKKEKQSSIGSWISGTSVDTKARDREARAKILADSTPTATAFHAQREALRAKEAAKAKLLNDKKTADQNEFKRKRQLELEKAKAEKAAAIERAKKGRGVSDHTAEAGSGLEGLGVLGKDHAPKGEGLMHSSDESEDEDDLDAELFGIKTSKKPSSGPQTNIVNMVNVQMPVKKRRVVRSVKDMRARLAPDLSPLHKIILGWDYFHNGDFPPKSRRDLYTAVPNTFRTPDDYQSTFEPLLTLEAWQGFVKAREENTFKPYEIRIVSRASVDAFQEVGSTMTHQENKDLHVSEGDIVLLSRSQSPSAEDPHCLARVFRVQRKQAHIEVSYRIMPGNPLQSSLVPNGKVYGSKIQSITPLEREYGALLGLQYYDLCDEIIRAKPSPLLNYRDSQLQTLIDNYNVNKAQAKAVKSAIDNDAFTLIQGPPGSGKTKTIVAIVGAILSDSLRHKGTPMPGQTRSDAAAKKLLVCAPSNAAVDELVMRFKSGIKTLSGEARNINVVRLGRSDAINANVQDVTLDELVNKKLGLNPANGPDPEATRKIFQEHKDVSAQLQNVRSQLDSGAVKGQDASKLQDDMVALRRRKALLGSQIDQAKDNERLASRNADLNRRRAQEEILGNAHIICATLSGSGHEMFQGISIEFETVIVDEAAQCVEMSALIPLKYGCAKAILVGDPKQLPPTVFSKEAARFQYEQSLFVRMWKNHPNDIHLLDTQYRMHPEISSFPSKTFYDGRLLDGSDMGGLRKQPWHSSLLLGPYRFFDVQGQHQAAPKGHSLINIAEINVALQLYKRLTSDYSHYDFKGKIGIITPYKSQLRELKTRFSSQYGQSILEDVEFNTTDAFQGRESEVIIFSCVRASPAGGIGFLSDIRRMNVGLTRAKSSLWVLGNSQSLVRGEFWRKLVEDARQRDRYTEGNVQKMLSKHSSAFPAPKDAYQAPVTSLPALVKEEPQDVSMSRSPSTLSGQGFEEPQSNGKQSSYLSARQGLETYKHGPADAWDPSSGKRKWSRDADDDVKMEDVDVEDADASAATSEAATPTESHRSTPTPAPEPTKPNVANVMAGMTKPKIRRRPREAPNPLLTRPPKKPRNS
ncbi:tRNA-splicing endonuclease-like protein [Polyplosphaeria fusca]|uniref:tRNA-splicing endonuclease-like protein n=1 Tax=Polyplosphaeria fusca TaxID=682080 RepID=A0A9P4R6A1_9PLEO|nr:tRNA-splicing endonuclease-like protein [Polyplosphaeria fusca]